MALLKIASDSDLHIDCKCSRRTSYVKQFEQRNNNVENSSTHNGSRWKRDSLPIEYLQILSSGSVASEPFSSQPSPGLKLSKQKQTRTMSHSSQVRQNFHQDCEDAINKQINLELHASYVYMAMAYHFQRDDVALPGFHKYFKEASLEERGHATKLMDYLNSRGGRIVLKDVEAPEHQEWESPLVAMHEALNLEKRVNESLLGLHSTASGHMDVNLCDFLETHYLQEQVDAIKEIGDHVTNLRRVGEGLGVFMFDQRLCEDEC